MIRVLAALVFLAQIGLLAGLAIGLLSGRSHHVLGTLLIVALFLLVLPAYCAAYRALPSVVGRVVGHFGAAPGTWQAVAIFLSFSFLCLVAFGAVLGAFRQLVVEGDAFLFFATLAVGVFLGASAYFAKTHAAFAASQGSGRRSDQRCTP